MDENSDSGWIKGLPTGWVDGCICTRRLFSRLKEECADIDPAPWHDVLNPDYWGPFFGKTPADHVFYAKLEQRLVAAFQKAVFSGQLAPSWFDGAAFKSIPAFAFGNASIVRNALQDGGFEVDPLWPDEWQPWSGQGWAIPKHQFELWMQGSDALSLAGLPIAGSELPTCDIDLIISRKLTEASRVPLSEAISWIAFGVALDAERLERALRWQSLAGGDLQAAQRQIEAAAETLLKAGADGLVPIFGRHKEEHGEKGKRTEKIDPLSLEDYRKAWITQDRLHYGTGLFCWYRAPNDCHLRGSERGDHFANVTVEREALLKYCGPRLDSADSLLMAIPAVLPGVGVVMGLEEAVCLLAFGRPSHDISVWTDDSGNIMILDPSGLPLPKVTDGEKPPALVAYIEANRRLWDALQDGTLRAFIAPTEGHVLSIPRIYWNAINSECLEYLYQGTSKADAGRGSPVLLSRKEFEERCKGLRAKFQSTSKAVLQSNGGNVPLNRQLDHGKIIGLVVEMRGTQPGITKGSAAASIVADLPPNPTTGKRRDTRHIERIIAHLWEGGLSQSPA